MVIGSPSSSSSASSVSSLSSLGCSSDEVSVKGGGGSSTTGGGTVVKFLCSYGGKILPRYPDGRLRYVGGDTRVLAVDRSVPFSELAAKLGELCGCGVAVSLRCQLPTEDLDALVSVTSDEDLANLFEEYDLAGRDRANPLKIKAFLNPMPSSSSPTLPKAPPPVAASAKGKTPFSPAVTAAAGHRAHHHHHHHQISSSSTAASASAAGFPGQLATDVRYHHHYQPHPQQQQQQQQQQQHLACYVHGGGGNPASSYRQPHQQHVQLVHNGNHWQ